MPARKKLTVAELIALKGKRKIIVSTAFDEWTARAAEEAGVDMVLAWGGVNGMCSHEYTKCIIKDVRRGAPNMLIGTGINPGAYVSVEEALRLATDVREAGADVIYCSGLVVDKWAPLRRQHHPCCGHVGYRPADNTWYGGPRAVGKTAEEAKKVYDEVMALEAAGCIGVEMECVPAQVAAEITKRTKLLTFSMGSGPDCDGQFIFAEDILGTNDGHYPRHSITYANLLKDAVKALGQYREEVVSGAYPAANHCIKMKDEEFAAFMDAINSHSPSVPASLPLHKPKNKKLTVADLIALKGKRRFVLTTAFDEFTAKVAEEVGVDMVVGWGKSHEHTKFILDNLRRGAPNTLIGTGINPGAFVSDAEALRLANEVRGAGADIVYSSGMVMERWAALRRQHFPCCGHVGYLPVNDTWYGGPRAVGKTADEAKKIYDDVMALEAAGCIAVEMECVPAKVAAEITKRTKMLVISMGSGPDCDGQYIFAEDILGTNAGHYPRHSITYGHLYTDAVKAFGQYCADTVSGAYPTAKHSIKMKDEEFASFMEAINVASADTKPQEKYCPLGNLLS